MLIGSGVEIKLSLFKTDNDVIYSKRKVASSFNWYKNDVMGIRKNKMASNFILDAFYWARNGVPSVV